MTKSKKSKPKKGLKPPKRLSKASTDQRQPKWLFPPDSENPVLHPELKTDEKRQQDKMAHDEAISNLKRRVHSATDIPPPPAQLRTLIGAFLTRHGMNSTSRIFLAECNNRQVLNGWEAPVDSQLPKDIPTLEEIYIDWIKGETSQKQVDDDSEDNGSDTGVATTQNLGEVLGAGVQDEDEESSEDEAGIEAMNSSKRKVLAKSDSSSSASSESDADGEDEPQPIKTGPVPKKGTMKKEDLKSQPAGSSSSEESADSEYEESRAHQKVKKLQLAKKALVNSSSEVKSSSGEGRRDVSKIAASTSLPLSSSESDSPDTENASAPPKKSAAKVTNPPATKFLKRKAESSSEAASSSSNEESSDDEPAAKKIKTEPSKSKAADSSSEDSSSSSGSSDSDTEMVEAPLGSKKKSIAASQHGIKPARGNSTDSSATINGDSKAPTTSITPATSDSSATSASDSLVTPATEEKKKHIGARPTRLAEQSANAQDGQYLSNNYQSYDYADRAHKDLSVTKGKGFTKEKNKKKRGSYRGGLIDTAGGKAYKFED